MLSPHPVKQWISISPQSRNIGSQVDDEYKTNKAHVSDRVAAERRSHQVEEGGREQILPKVRVTTGHRQNVGLP